MDMSGKKTKNMAANLTQLESRVSAIFHSFPSHFSLKASLHSWVMSASLALAAQMLRTKLSPARCHPEAYSDATKGQHHPASRKPRYKQSVEQHVSSHKPYLQAKAGTASMRDRDTEPPCTRPFLQYWPFWHQKIACGKRDDVGMFRACQELQEPSL